MLLVVAAPPPLPAAPASPARAPAAAMESAFNVDMNAAGHWPVAVGIVMRVDYPSGLPEVNRVRLEPCPAPSAVRIVKSTGNGEPEVEMARWTELPGSTLFLRCLNLMAINLFGSVEMPPRVVGPPLWQALTLDVAVDHDDPQALHVELSVAAASRANLRYRLRRDQPMPSQVVVLDTLDADPWRAMLRLGMQRVRPVLRTSRAVRGAAGGRAAGRTGEPVRHEADSGDA